MKHTVLVAAEYTDLCHLYRRFLDKSSYKVSISKSIPDCLQKLRDLNPSVLMLDLEFHRSGSNGEHSSLRSECRSRGIPIIVTTAGHGGVDYELLAPPVVECLCKPFMLTTLLESLHVATGNGAPYPTTKI